MNNPKFTVFLGLVLLLAALAVQALDDPRAIGKGYHAFDPDRTRFRSIPAN